MGGGVTPERVAQFPEHSAQIGNRGAFAIGARYRKNLPGGVRRTHTFPYLAATLQAEINRPGMPGFQQSQPLIQR